MLKTGMAVNKNFEVYKHILQMIRITSVSFVVFAFFFISIPFLLRSDLIIFKESLLKLALFISPLFFLLSMALDRTFVLLKKCKITLTESSIVFTGFFEKRTIVLAEVESFKYVKRVFGSNQLLLKTSRNTVKIPIYFFGLSEFIRLTRKQFNNLSKSSVYDSKNLVDFELKSRYTDQVSSLMEMSVPSLLTAFLIIFSLNILVILYFWEIPVIFAILWIIQSMLYPGASYLVSYSIVTGLIKKSIKDNPQNPKSPDIRGPFIYSGIFFGLLFLISGIMLRYAVYTHWTKF